MGTTNWSGGQLNKSIRIVLASRSKPFLEGTRKILENEGVIKVIAEASNQEAIGKYLAETKPNFLFLDNRILKLDIHKLYDLINKRSPDTRVIVFDSHTETDVLDLIYTIKSLSKTIQTKKIAEVAKHKLTRTEIKIVKLLVEGGFSNKEIAKKLSIGEKTVKFHLHHIFKKLGLQNRYQLIAYARQLRDKIK
jgi:DNA-binding NarL/FixJ family response regulator